MSHNEIWEVNIKLSKRLKASLLLLITSIFFCPWMLFGSSACIKLRVHKITFIRDGMKNVHKIVLEMLLIAVFTF